MGGRSMKAAAFGVVRAESVDQVLAALAEYGDEARVIAGGQSLGPLMALRLSAPEVLVDLGRVPGLATIDTVDGGIRLGAMARQRAAERDPQVRAAAPLVTEAVPHIGHPAIRTQGTVCGSLAHADPAAELPTVALATGATMHLRSASGSRDVAADDFFTGYYSTAVGPTELLEAVTFPALAAPTGCAFTEFSRRHGDFALVGVAAVVTLGPDGSITAARLALSGVASTPWLAATAASVLGGVPTGSGRSAGTGPQMDGAPVRPEAPTGAAATGSGRSGSVAALPVDAALRPGTRDAIRAAAEAVRVEVDPSDDLHATAAYRRHLAAVLTERALATAIARAQEATG